MHVPRPVATAALHAVLCLASAFAFPPPLTAQTRFAAFRRMRRNGSIRRSTWRSI